VTTKTKAKPKTKTKPAKPPAPIADPEEAMWKAVQKQDRAGILAAVAAGASLDGALHSVVYAETKLSPKDVARAKLLLELGADPAYQHDEDNQTTVLFELAFAPNQDAALEVLGEMLKKAPKLKAKPDKLKRWPLHVAMWYGKQPAFWDKLVALGCPIDAKDQRGNTALFDALGHGNHKGVEWLVGKGASLDGAVDYAKDPKHYCAEKTIAFVEKLAAK